jgi:tripartite-type tricarboxylate transporter receptor subunit TctC
MQKGAEAMTSQRISDDLIALAKEKPGQISFGSASIGSSGHLASEMLKTRAGIEMVHVPYKGDNPAMKGSDRRPD